MVGHSEPVTHRKSNQAVEDRPGPRLSCTCCTLSDTTALQPEQSVADYRPHVPCPIRQQPATQRPLSYCFSYRTWHRAPPGHLILPHQDLPCIQGSTPRLYSASWTSNLCTSEGDDQAIQAPSDLLRRPRKSIYTIPRCPTRPKTKTLLPVSCSIIIYYIDRLSWVAYSVPKSLSTQPTLPVLYHSQPPQSISYTRGLLHAPSSCAPCHSLFHISLHARTTASLHGQVIPRLDFKSPRFISHPPTQPSHTPRHNN